MKATFFKQHQDKIEKLIMKALNQSRLSLNQAKAILQEKKEVMPLCGVNTPSTAALVPVSSMDPGIIKIFFAKKVIASVITINQQSEPEVFLIREPNPYFEWYETHISHLLTEPIELKQSNIRPS